MMDSSNNPPEQKLDCFSLRKGWNSIINQPLFGNSCKLRTRQGANPWTPRADDSGLMSLFWPAYRPKAGQFWKSGAMVDAARVSIVYIQEEKERLWDKGFHQLKKNCVHQRFSRTGKMSVDGIRPSQNRSRRTQANNFNFRHFRRQDIPCFINIFQQLGICPCFNNLPQDFEEIPYCSDKKSQSCLALWSGDTSRNSKGCHFLAQVEPESASSRTIGYYPTLLPGAQRTLKELSKCARLTEAHSSIQCQASPRKWDRPFPVSHSRPGRVWDGSGL